MGIEVQNMDLENSKMSFEVQKRTFDGCQDQNDFQKYSGIFPGHSGLIFDIFKLY